MMHKPHIVILGAGPAGLGAAYQLSRQSPARVTMLEQNESVGGIAGSFDLGGMRMDYGSHRLHPACDPLILDDIRTLLGDDLLDRTRHGRIRLSGRWIHFPLRPADLALRLPVTFSLGIGMDILRSAIPHRASSAQDSFASALQSGLGTTICRDFYFPYSQKLWGLSPEDLSVTQANRRMATTSLRGMIGKALGLAAGPRSTKHASVKGRFYYPRRGFGEICDAYARAAIEAGVTLHTNARMNSIAATGDGRYAVFYLHEGHQMTLTAEQVWSTIPVTDLVHAIRPRGSDDAVPDSIQRAAQQIHYRGMVLVYMVLEQSRFTEYDAHYFPSLDVPISRLSEPGNYRGDALSEPGAPRRTALCAEIPCEVGGPEWSMSDRQLSDLVQVSLITAGIGIHSPITEIATRRLAHAYPVYERGYEIHLESLESYLDSMEGLVSFGRQGSFAHDNIHHALQTGYAAADCLREDGAFDRAQWKVRRQDFRNHVVED